MFGQVMSTKAGALGQLDELEAGFVQLGGRPRTGITPVKHPKLERAGHACFLVDRNSGDTLRDPGVWLFGLRAAHTFEPGIVSPDIEVEYRVPMIRRRDPP